LHDNKYKLELSKILNKEKRQGNLQDAIKGSDVFIGLSKPNILTKENIETMNKDAIVFAMANPIPEIMPDEAKSAGALIVATGRSDFPNQVNNALAFPGIFRGALDCKAKKITESMKIAAAHAIASLIPNPTKDQILPAIFDKQVPIAVAEAVKRAWIKEN
jgi:malate dehydrogenase (oxaloacetate-decarboxylating)